MLAPRRGTPSTHPIILLAAALLVVGTVVLLVKQSALPITAGLWQPRTTAQLQTAEIVKDLTRLRAAATIIDPNTMQHVPQVFDPQYKNPCWLAMDTAGKPPQLMCLPYVYVSGFFTGVGSLISKLTVHPNVVKDAGPISMWGSDWGMWSEYRSSFPAWLHGIHSNGATPAALNKDPKTSIVIDGARGTSSLYWAASGKVHQTFSTTAVALWKVCHDNFTKGPQYEECMDNVCLARGRSDDYKAAAAAGLNYEADLHLPLLVRAVYGAKPPRLVVLVRNPVKRMYSNYFGRKTMWEKHGNTSAGFTRFVDEQMAAWNACVNGLTVHGKDGNGGPPVKHTDQDCYLRFESLSMREEQVFYHNDQLFRGLYAPYLRIWMRFLPHENIRVLKASDFYARPDEITNQVLAFLDLPLLPGISAKGAEGRVKYLSEADAQRVMRAGGQKTFVESAGPMANETRHKLLEFYKPYNEQLVQLLGDTSIRAWNTWSGDDSE